MGKTVYRKTIMLRQTVTSDSDLVLLHNNLSYSKARTMLHILQLSRFGRDGSPAVDSLLTCFDLSHASEYRQPHDMLRTRHRHHYFQEIIHVHVTVLKSIEN